MNREAVALGTPVWTTFEGRLGAVDERLIAEGRLRHLRSPADVEVRRREHTAAAERVRRDPGAFTDLLLAPHFGKVGQGRRSRPTRVEVPSSTGDLRLWRAGVPLERLELPKE